MIEKRRKKENQMDHANVTSRVQSFNANKSNKHLHRFRIYRNQCDAVHSTTNAMFGIITITLIDLSSC